MRRTGPAAGLAVMAALAALTGGLFGARRVATFADVVGTSMAPTFADGERVFALARRRYRVGDVVVFRTPAHRRFGTGPGGGPAWRVKRVAAAGGDPVPAWLPLPVPRVPAGTVVVAGDGPRSEDSRHLGLIPCATIAGRVVPGRRPRGPA